VCLDRVHRRAAEAAFAGEEATAEPKEKGKEAEANETNAHLPHRAPKQHPCSRAATRPEKRRTRGEGGKGKGGGRGEGGMMGEGAKTQEREGIKAKTMQGTGACANARQRGFGVSAFALAVSGCAREGWGFGARPRHESCACRVSGFWFRGLGPSPCSLYSDGSTKVRCTAARDLALLPPTSDSPRERPMPPLMNLDPCVGTAAERCKFGGYCATDRSQTLKQSPEQPSEQNRCALIASRCTGRWGLGVGGRVWVRVRDAP
jgi:hypothetical protein